MDNKDGDKKITLKSLGYNKYMERNPYLEDALSPLDLAIKHKQLALLNKKLEKVNIENSLHTTPYKKLMTILLSQDSHLLKRLKVAIKIAELIFKGEAVSDYELAKCINPSVQREKFESARFEVRIENKIRTLRKYIAKEGYKIIRIKEPFCGYILTQ